MERQQTNGIWIGAISTAYFLAIALSTMWVKKALEKWGATKIVTLGLAVTATVAPLFSLTDRLDLWFLIRSLMGWGVCCFLVGAQTLLNHLSPPDRRAGINGFYFLSLGIGFTLGSLIGPRFYELAPMLGFGSGSIALGFGLAIAGFGLPRSTRVSVSRSTFQVLAIEKIGVPLYGIFAYGVAEATLLTLYPVFLLRQNYSLNQIGAALAVFVVGSILSTLPVTLLADRFGTNGVLSASVAIGIVTIGGLVLGIPYEWLLGFSFFAGASVGPVYPLCLASIGEKLSSKELPAGTASFTTAYSLGNAAGPIFSSLAMELMGGRYIFSLCLPLFLVLLLLLNRHSRLIVKKAISRY